MGEIVQAAALGVASGVVTAMPMAGPNGALILARLLGGRWRAAGLVALGAAITAGIYAAAAGLALGSLLPRDSVILPILRGVGALVVGAAGILLVARPAIASGEPPRARRASLVTGIALAAVNPAMLASFAVIEGALWANGWLALDAASALSFAAGVLAGRMTWFAVLALLRRPMTAALGGPRKRTTMRVVGGVLLAAAAALGHRFAAGLGLL